MKDLRRDKEVKPTVLKMFWTCYSDATASCSELGAVSSQTRQFKGYWAAFYVALQRNEIPSEKRSPKGGLQHHVGTQQLCWDSQPNRKLPTRPFC